MCRLSPPQRGGISWSWRQLMTFGCWRSKNVLQFRKAHVESFSTRQILVLTQKNLSERSRGLFRGLWWRCRPAAAACSSSISLMLRWCKNVPGEQARFLSHACPNSQVTKLFLECIKSLLEEGAKKQLILLSVQCVVNKRQAETEGFYSEGRNRMC